MRLRLKPQELKRVRHLLGIEEPRAIRRANILNCLNLGYLSSDIAMILNVDPKTVSNVGHAYLEGGLDSALFDEERSGRPIDFDDRGRLRIWGAAFQHQQCRRTGSRGPAAIAKPAGELD